MGEDGLRYDAMVEDALRGVVRRALNFAAERGLPGDHHFYISFRTNHPGVDIPDSLRSRYPNEMTIVLQYQFWGLDVGDEAFGVTLSFSDVPERLTIPFAAVSAFADPSIRFGLQFDSSEAEDGAAVTPVPAPEQRREPAQTSDAEGGAPAFTPVKPTPVKAATKTAKSESAEAAEDAGGVPGGKVITLDSFRKK